MQLVPLRSVEWRYDSLSAIEPAEEGDGRLFGQGAGVFTGRITGEATWSNNARLRGGYAYPDARGVLRLASLTDGRGLHTMTFETGSPTHTWLNTVFAIGEGSIDLDTSTLALQYYECVVELPGERAS